MPTLAVVGAGPKGIAIAAKAVTRAMADYSSPRHLMRHGTYADWVDRGRLRPTHRAAGDRWRLALEQGPAIEADGVVFTGPQALRGGRRHQPRGAVLPG